MIEAEFQQKAQEFLKQLKNYPQLGKRPFGYPKGAWWMSGGMFLFGMVCQLPLFLTAVVELQTVLGSVFGALLVACGFTMRVMAFTSAAAGAMDLWLYERVEALEKQLKDKGNA